MVQSPARHQSVIERAQPIAIQLSAATDTGKRENNEDQYLIANVRRSLVVRASSLSPALAASDKHHDSIDTLLMVADGIGGYAGGELASSTATRQLASDLLWSLGIQSRASSRQEELSDRLTASIARAHEAVRRLAARPGIDENVGTTVTLGYLEWPHLYVAHVGDSRAYLFREGHLQRLTTDHTMAEQLRNSDILPEGTQPAPRYEHILTNSVGGHGEPVADVETHRLSRGDTLLFCTDGLTGSVDDQMLADELRLGHPVEHACARLLESARVHGAEDNTTVVLARIV